MLPLSSLLSGRMRESGLARQVVIAQILEEARKFIKEKWGARAEGAVTIRSLVRGEIIACADSPAMAQELRLRQSEVVQRINAKFGGKVVTGFRFVSR